MQYELLKQLAEAGFPHNLCEWTDEHPERDSNRHVPEVGLSELIEAVRISKDNNFSLVYNDEWSIYEEPKENRWQARYYPHTPIVFYEAEGTTPEEAVAKLWLAINKK